MEREKHASLNPPPGSVVRLQPIRTIAFVSLGLVLGQFRLEPLHLADQSHRMGRKSSGRARPLALESARVGLALLEVGV